MADNLSYAKGATDVPLIEQTIGAFFDDMVARQPEREALVSRHEGRRFTYRELQAESNRLASALLNLGLLPGDRVGIWSHNNVPWVLMQVATAKVGLILVNINPAYRTSELDYALNKVGVKALVTMAQFKTSDYLGMLRELGPLRLPLLQHTVWIDKAGDADQAGMQRFSALLASGDPQDPRIAQIGATLKATDPINVQFTSGTTGFPKGATLTHRNILNNGFFIGECMKLTPQDRLCIPVPLYHCFGMVLGNLAVLTHGSTIVYPNDGFDPLTVLETVQAEKCTGLHGVPTMFIAELDHPRFAEFDMSTLRTGIMAGSPCPTEVMKRVVEKMNLREITIAYGMTETSPVSCQSSTDTPQVKRVSTVGTVQPHLEIKIVDPETGATVPRGQSGEFLTRGYSVMHGYWEDEAKTREAIDAEHWMHTGDLATMDDEGYVNIVGRIKDLVIRGGENIYPREIEEFLYRHPKVQDVQVVGLPDKRYGEELCAWIIVKPGQTATEDEVRDFCKGQIAHYKVPKYIQFVTEFPMTVTGKIQKFKIRDAMKSQLGLDEEKTA
ncbi:MAG: AMP-binding protein [Variovorax sp.]|nr:MAG: AMP-binding protein [Variovorax sp.]